MRPFDAISFDLDSTLLDGRDFHRSTIETCNIVAATSGRLSAAALLEANQTAFAEYLPECFDDWTLGILSGEALGRESWRRALRKCGETSESLVDLAATTHHRLAQDTYRLFPDVRDLLNRLAAASIPLALVTNGASDTQRDKLHALGILDAFAVLSISGEIGAAKPDGLAFAPVLEGITAAPDRIWHIGDNLETDILGAQSVGMRSIWLNRDGVRNETGIVPDVCIESLRELTALLDGSA